MSSVPSSSVAAQAGSNLSTATSPSRAETMAPPLAKSTEKVVAWGPADAFDPAPMPARHLRTAQPTGVAVKARCCLTLERGDRFFTRLAKAPEFFSQKSLHEAQANYVKAHAIDPRSPAPVLGLVKTAEVQLAHVRPLAPCDKSRAQADIVAALSAIVDFLTEGSDPDLVSILGQSHPLLGERLTLKAKRVVLDKLLPTLELLLTAAAYETTGDVRTTALKTLAHLVTHQAWAAAPSLSVVQKWATNVKQATLAEVAAGCEVICQTLGQDKVLAPHCRQVALTMIKNAGADREKRALCAPLIAACMHGVDRSRWPSNPSKRLQPYASTKKT